VGTEARGETGRLNAHLELGPAFPVSGWQAEDLGPGLYGAGRLELALARWVGVDLGASYLGFYGHANPPGYEPLDGAYLIAASAGLRFRVLDDDAGYLWSWGPKRDHTGNLWGNLWLDLHGGYVYTGGEHRFGADAGLGAQLSIVNGLQLGPFVRAFYVHQPDSENRRDSEDAWILLAGLGGSIAIPPDSKVIPDSDGDGLLDPDDACPKDAEDTDGFEDGDGCPDEDNDRDQIPDTTDRCPEEPEDTDGFEDEDGCPDEDNDRDQIPDTTDRCPDEAEDHDLFEDEDGCPELDNDGDGILDVDDTCPEAAETHNGFEDEDGCPEPDDDGDGLANAIDKCPNEPETINGVDDEDGCPDQGLVQVEDDLILGGDRIFFGKGRVRFKGRSRPTLQHLASLLEAHPEYTVISIEGHADHSGPRMVNRDLSRLRAERIRDNLIRQGIDPERLRVVAYGENKPWKKGRREDIRALNRRVEFRIQELDPGLAKTPVAPQICRALGFDSDCGTSARRPSP